MNLNLSVNSMILPTLLATLISVATPSAHADETVHKNNCTTFLQSPVTTKRFLIVFDQIAMGVIKQTQVAHPAHVTSGAASTDNLSALLNVSVNELASHPSRFDLVISKAQFALGRRDLTFAQEVGIFMASKAQTLPRFIILDALGFNKIESVQIASSFYSDED